MTMVKKEAKPWQEELLKIASPADHVLRSAQWIASAKVKSTKSMKTHASIVALVRKCVR
jgi:hypothetical protein